MARDTAFAVASSIGLVGYTRFDEGAAVVAPFERVAVPPGERVVARWSDGEVAAADHALGDGCIRSIGVVVPVAGDLALTSAFRQFARRMVSSCNAPTVLARVADSVVARVLLTAPRRGDVPSPTASDTSPGPGSRLVAWLLGTALVLAVLELFVRRGESHAAA